MTNVPNHPLYQPDEPSATEHLYLTPIEGLFCITNPRHSDERGFFTEIAQVSQLNQATQQDFHIQQINLSYSEQNVIRGFHAENWNKLVTIPSGVVYSVLLDIRPHSATFLQTVHVLLGESDEAIQGALYIPRGVANSICVVKGPVSYFYAVDSLYTERNPLYDQAISVFDPTLAIEWPVSRDKAILSQRDQDAVLLSDKFPESIS